MTPEQEKEMQAHVQAIAAILYQNTPSEQLTSLEGIEIAVRQQILEHVSPEIGSFYPHSYGHRSRTPQASAKQHRTAPPHAKASAEAQSSPL